MLQDLKNKKDVFLASKNIAALCGIMVKFQIRSPLRVRLGTMWERVEQGLAHSPRGLPRGYPVSPKERGLIVGIRRSVLIAGSSALPRDGQSWRKMSSSAQKNFLKWYQAIAAITCCSYRWNI